MGGTMRDDERISAKVDPAILLTLFDSSTVRLKLRDDESKVLELVSMLAKRGRLLRIEINGASLEDIFVELTQKSGGRS
jgi:hypothetical protein